MKIKTNGISVADRFNAVVSIPPDKMVKSASAICPAEDASFLVEFPDEVQDRCHLSLLGGKEKTERYCEETRYPA